jgi:hypothetical protein
MFCIPIKDDIDGISQLSFLRLPLIMGFVRLLVLSALIVTPRAVSVDISRVGTTFTIEEIPIDSSQSAIADVIRAPYFKFGLDIPADIEDAIIREVLPGQSSIPSKSVDFDQEYGLFFFLLIKTSAKLFISHQRASRKSDSFA